MPPSCIMDTPKRTYKRLSRTRGSTPEMYEKAKAACAAASRERTAAKAAITRILAHGGVPSVEHQMRLTAADAKLRLARLAKAAMVNFGPRSNPKVEAATSTGGAKVLPLLGMQYRIERTAEGLRVVMAKCVRPVVEGFFATRGIVYRVDAAKNEVAEGWPTRHSDDSRLYAVTPTHLVFTDRKSRKTVAFPIENGMAGLYTIHGDKIEPIQIL